MLELFAIGIAVLVGWGVAHGLKGHMEKEPEPDVIKGGSVTLPAKSCTELFDELPTGSSDIDNVRNAVKKAYIVASTAEDAATLEALADMLETAPPSGYPAQAQCLRERAKQIRAGTSFPVESTSSATPVSTAAPSGVVFPSGD